MENIGLMCIFFFYRIHIGLLAVCAHAFLVVTCDGKAAGYKYCLYECANCMTGENAPLVVAIATAQNLTRSAKCGQQTLSHTPKKTWTMFVEFWFRKETLTAIHWTINIFLGIFLNFVLQVDLDNTDWQSCIKHC